MNELLLCLVIGISDGDTLTARCGSQDAYTQVKVRIAAIDAPEGKQPFGKASKRALSKLCYKQQATIERTDIDRYKRTVANVMCQNQDAAQYMVKNGMAWVYDRYAKKHQHLYNDEHIARIAQRGLWADKDAMPPWMWRRRR